MGKIKLNNLNRYFAQSTKFQYLSQNFTFNERENRYKTKYLG